MLTREWHNYSDPSLKSISTNVIRCPCQTCYYVTNTPALAESVTNETFQQAHAAVNSNQRRATPFRDMLHCLSSGGWELYAEDAAVRARSLTLPCFFCYLRVTTAGLECFFFFLLPRPLQVPGGLDRNVAAGYCYEYLHSLAHNISEMMVFSLALLKGIYGMG